MVLLSSDTLNSVIRECYQLKNENIPPLVQLISKVCKKWINSNNDDIIRNLTMLLSQCGETVITYILKGGAISLEYLSVVLQYFSYNDASIGALLFDFFIRINVYLYILRIFLNQNVFKNIVLLYLLIY